MKSKRETGSKEDQPRAVRINYRLSYMTGPAWQEYLRSMPDDGNCGAGLLARDIYGEGKPE